MSLDRAVSGRTKQLPGKVAVFTLSVANDVVNRMGPCVLILIELEEQSKQVAECLKQSGRKVLLAKDFVVGKRVLQTKNITLIICDIHPENGGSVFDFLRWLKKDPVLGTTPFALFSVRPTKRAKYLEDGLRITARLLGCDEYISMEKFDPEKFLDIINCLLSVKEETIPAKTKEDHSS